MRCRGSAPPHRRVRVYDRRGSVAALLLVIGALGVLQLFDAATRNNFRAQQSQVVNDKLQAELEKLRALPYTELAMTANPGHSSDRNNPRWRVSGTNYAIGRDGSQLRPMVVNGLNGVSGGTINPGPTPFNVGDVSGNIYRFVTWAPLSGCPSLRRLGPQTGGRRGDDHRRAGLVQSRASRRSRATSSTPTRPRRTTRRRPPTTMIRSRRPSSGSPTRPATTASASRWRATIRFTTPAASAPRASRTGPIPVLRT